MMHLRLATKVVHCRCWCWPRLDPSLRLLVRSSNGSRADQYMILHSLWCMMPFFCRIWFAWLSQPGILLESRFTSTLNPPRSLAVGAWKPELQWCMQDSPFLQINDDSSTSIFRAARIPPEQKQAEWTTQNLESAWYRGALQHWNSFSGCEYNLKTNSAALYDDDTSKSSRRIES
jgi:hypothetical protein